MQEVLSNDVIAMYELRALKAENRREFDHIRLAGKGRTKAVIISEFRKWLNNNVSPIPSPPPKNIFQRLPNVLVHAVCSFLRKQSDMRSFKDCSR